MEKTPKLNRKCLSLNVRLRNSSSPSIGEKTAGTTSTSTPTRASEAPDPILPHTPPNSKYKLNPATTPPTSDIDSPQSILSQSSTNSPDVIWRWTQDDPQSNNIASLSSLIPRDVSIESKLKAIQKRKSRERREKHHQAELQKRKANRIKRDMAYKQQCEQMEQLIARNIAKCAREKSEPLRPPIANKERSPMNSSGYGSNGNDAIDLLNDSISDDLLLQATQNIEVIIQSSQKEVENSKKTESETEPKNSSMGDFLHDSLDDWFASLDADLLVAQPKPSLQRYNSMPTAPPNKKPVTDSSKFKRFPSTSTIPSKSRKIG